MFGILVSKSCSLSLVALKNRIIDGMIGYREVDDESSTWYDWDEDCHGRMDDQEDEYPEGFIWTCCEQSGDCDGCQTGPHAEESLSSKRARY